MFEDANNVLSSGGSFTHNSITSSSSLRLGGLTPIHYLWKEISPDAVHDSPERPNLSEITPSAAREQVIQEIMTWIRNPQRSHNIARIRGAEGSGKTVISQEVAERCAEHGMLAASFFFLRGSSDRNHTRVRRFCTTLAYQLALNIPELKEGIEKVIEADPSVPRKAVGAQFKKLILEPIAQNELSRRHDLPCVIVVDGVDDCLDGTYQSSILRCIFLSLEQLNFPFCFVITSQPNSCAIRELDSPPYDGQRWALDLDNRKYATLADAVVGELCDLWITLYDLAKAWNTQIQTTVYILLLLYFIYILYDVATHESL
ncbi:hypothetical protein M413DRAFT_443639 [Hebeloma cylindrosporum]|uniref:Nephrocystin 3-like N-terminal domain-containing protein n=1 Tax=Hebeloma cylindrosporum TaxID=76867 RepID=A0A0C3CHX4_HEBCY|nr:hypothetical protein M413DRAFT_443639 [Hebeloma cylindrosporum h7]